MSQGVRVKVSVGQRSTGRSDHVRRNDEKCDTYGLVEAGVMIRSEDGACIVLQGSETPPAEIIPRYDSWQRSRARRVFYVMIQRRSINIVHQHASKADPR